MIGTAVVIGASFAGLLAGTAAAQTGYDVVVLERDDLPLVPQPRAGVPQSPQPHVLLRRGLLAIDGLLPGVGAELLRRGGVPFNTGQMPWLGEFGWSPLHEWAYEIISISRPLLEKVVRDRVMALTEVQLRTGSTVTRLRRASAGWEVVLRDGGTVTADVVIDASGRGSRLPHWLAELDVPVPAPAEVEARVGYACRSYRGRLALHTGVMVAATPEIPVGGLALPVEDDRWLICTVGFGEHRPTRDVAEFEAFLAGLRDPALTDLAAGLAPEGDVAIHRQTSNRRYAYGTTRSWPAGLLVVGDAMCAFDPIYGQGITVSACQAELLAAGLRRRPTTAVATRRLQRRLAAVADLPWSVATSEDLRMPSSAGQQNLGQRALGHWTRRMVRLAAGGDEACARAFSAVYHLMGSPAHLLGPRVVRSVLRSLVRGVPEPAPRPAVLATLNRR
ncbi:MAG: NAD(P)/FAD-dependent oxidoreductase [Propionibacteriaceae bacterium]